MNDHGTPPAGGLHRIVDRDNWGWTSVMSLADTDQSYVRQDSRLPDVGPLTEAQLRDRFGPVRPVTLLVPPDAEEELRTVLERAGRKALVTVGVALHQVTLADIKAHAHTTRPRGPLLTAGDPGGWRASAIVTLARQVGPETSARRVCLDALEPLARHVTAWVTGPTVYVDPGAALGRLLAEASTAAGGFEKITDQHVTGVPGVEGLRQWILRSGPA